MCVVGETVTAGCLGSGDTVRIVAGITRYISSPDMSVMFGEAVIATYAVTAVTTVTQGVGGGTLRGIVGGIVTASQDAGIDRTVWSVRTRSAYDSRRIAVVAVEAGNDAAGGIGRQQTRHIGIGAEPQHRVIRRIAGIELQGHVGLVMHPGRRRGGFVRAVTMATETELVDLRNRFDAPKPGLIHTTHTAQLAR